MSIDVAAIAPAPELLAGADGVLATAPAPSLSALFIAGRAITVDATAPAPESSATILTGEVIAFAGTAPSPLLGSGTKDFRGTAPAPTLSARLVPSNLIVVRASAAPPLLIATLVNVPLIVFAGTAPAPRLSASLGPGNILSAILTAPVPSITARILTGNVASFIASAPAPIVLVVGYPAYTLAFAGTAPSPQFSATLSAAVASAYRTWVLNTKKGALTEYGPEWAMNSYAVFNGKVLGCTSSGIVELGTQNLDNATAISSTVKSGASNFGTSVIKRVPRIYLDYKTAGDAQFALITTEGGTRRYALNWNNVTGSQTRRIPVGKGPKSARWQWEYTNVGGADFDIGAVLAYPQKLRRRVQ